MLYLGDKKIKELYLGDVKIKEAYLGNVLVYRKEDKDYIEIGGVKWAKFNVGAPGTFAGSIYDYGMFYKFNNKVGWPATGEISANNPASDGATAWDATDYGEGYSLWMDYNDPSPDGWRLPIYDELMVLDLSFSVWDDVSKGRWFSDAEADLGNPGKSIFLPAAGYRWWYIGHIVERDIAGYHWASTIRSGTGDCSYSANDSYSKYTTLRRISGAPIRCVKI